MRNLLPAAAFVTLVLSCATLPKEALLEFEKAPLFGMVYDGASEPVGGALVMTDGEFAAATDINGRFVVPDLARGRHTCVVRREEYEDVTVEFDFMSRGQVIYVRMTSFSQLLSLAETALGKREWGKAEAFLDRASRLKSDDPLVLFFRAILARKRNEPPTARRFLQELLDRGYKEPAVLLFLADIAQYDEGDTEEALFFLRSFSRLKSDPEIEARIQALEAKKP